jgi:hypothetical protein
MTVSSGMIWCTLRTIQRVGLGAWLVVMLAATGCGKAGIATYPVSGTVALDGQPLDGATVMFVPKSGPPHGAVTDAAGAFSIVGKPGVPAGPCRIMVTKPPAGAAAMSNPTPEDLQRISERATAPKPERSPIPEKYGRTETSGLTAEVTTDASKNVFTFELQR